MTGTGILERGDVFRHAGILWRVQYCNPCRAHCIQLERRRVRIKDRSFIARVTRTIDIAPNSIVTIVRSRNRGRP